MQHTPRQSNRSKLVILSLTLAISALTLVGCTSLLRVEPPIRVPGGDPELGKAALMSYACVTCHVVPGVQGVQSYVGPPLDAWAQRRFIAGTLTNEPDNLIRWIMDPQSVEPGTAMPNVGVDRDTARDIAAYLYTLEN